MIPFSDVKLLILKPEVFFKKIEKEKGKKRAITWALVSFIVYAVIALILTFGILGLIQNSLGSSEGVAEKIAEHELGLWFGLIFYFAMIPLVVVFLPIFHFIAVKLGAKGSKDQTLQASLYSYVPGFLLGWIPFFGSIAWIWSIYVQYKGFQFLHKMNAKQYIGYAILSTLAVILLSVMLAFFLLFLIIVLGTVLGVSP